MISVQGHVISFKRNISLRLYTHCKLNPDFTALFKICQIFSQGVNIVQQMAELNLNNAHAPTVVSHVEPQMSYSQQQHQHHHQHQQQPPQQHLPQVKVS